MCCVQLYEVSGAMPPTLTCCYVCDLEKNLGDSGLPSVLCSAPVCSRLLHLMRIGLMDSRQSLQAMAKRTCEESARQQVLNDHAMQSLAEQRALCRYNCS